VYILRAANFSQFVVFLFGTFPGSLFIFVWLATDFMRSEIVGPVIFVGRQFLK
jgi:hypothetical protein